MFLDVLSVQEFEALQVCPNQREEKKNNAAISVRIKSCYSSILFSHLNISEGGGGGCSSPVDLHGIICGMKQRWEKQLHFFFAIGGRERCDGGMQCEIGINEDR